MRHETIENKYNEKDKHKCIWLKAVCCPWISYPQSIATGLLAFLFSFVLPAAQRQWRVPSHYQDQCWNIVERTLRNKLQWNFDRIQIFSLKKMRLKVSSSKRQPFCLGLNVLWPFRHEFPRSYSAKILPIVSCPLWDFANSEQIHVICTIKDNHHGVRHG